MEDLPKSDNLRVYGVAVLANERETRPFIAAIQRRSRRQCATVGCTTFAVSGSDFCTQHDPRGEAQRAQTTNTLGALAVVAACGVALGQATAHGVPFAFVAVGCFGLGVVVRYVWERRAAAARHRKVRAPASPVEVPPPSPASMPPKVAAMSLPDFAAETVP